jgi:hypothetical protein
VDTIITPLTAAVGSTAAAGSLALIPIVLLLVLLILKEVASGLRDAAAVRLNRALLAAIVPLLLVFISTLVARLVDLYR